MDQNEKRKCARCRREVYVKEGVLLLRGATFACKDCHDKEQHENKDKAVCEFC